MIAFRRNIARYIDLPLIRSSVYQVDKSHIRSIVSGKVISKLRNITISRSDNWTKTFSSFSQLALTTPLNHSNVTPASPVAVLKDLICDITDVVTRHNFNQKSDWFARALEYNLRNGKHHRLQLTVSTYRTLMDPKDLTEENIKLANVLGWCAEMLHVALRTNQDLMDNSSTRCGQICWHRLQNVGIIAVNDALMFENAIYLVLKKYFGHARCFVELFELFREMSFVAANGQCLVLLNSKDPVTSFTMEKYKITAAIKTASISLHLPFALAMYLAGFENKESFEQAKEILLKISELYQIQRNYEDCFGDPILTGKLGTDIQDNKCTWLAVVCMQNANDEEKEIMLESYGKKDAEKIQTVKELYTTLGLPRIYSEHKEETYNTIKSQILQASTGVLQKALLQVLNHIYHR